jgi:ribonuclease VapC
MIVDSSAVVAILRNEPDRDVILRALVSAPYRAMAAPTLLETSMVIASAESEAVLEDLDQLMVDASLTVIPFTPEHAALARQAFLIYGKGRHKAGLNFGDCISYATARLASEPLLFKGDDFRLTDIEPAIQTPTASG